LEDRFAAMDLLAAGKTVNQVLEIMAEKHADWPMEKVRAAYFPSRGYFVISRFEGASRQEINKAKERLSEVQAAQQKRSRENLERLNRDSSFTARRNAAASRRMTALHQNPDFAAARDERIAIRWKDPAQKEAQRQRIIKQREDPEFRKVMLNGAINSWTPERRAAARDTDKLRKMIAIKRAPEERENQSRVMLIRRQDPEFQEANLEGIRRYWGKYHKNKLDMLEAMDIHVVSKSRGGYLRLGHISTPAEITIAYERKEILRGALAGLEPIERRIINLLFLAKSEAATLTSADVAKILEISADEVALILQRTIYKLSQNRRMKESL